MKGDPGGKADRYLNLKLKLPPSYFVFLRPVDRKTKKEVILLAEEIHSDYHGEVGLLVQNGCICEFEVFNMAFLLASMPSANGEWAIAGNME